MPSSASPSVSVVILNRNGRAHLASCLPGVLALDGLPGPESVVVADDGSTDGSLELVRQSFPGVRALGWRENVGFAAGNNRAMRAETSDRVLLLNNDTAIAPGALAALLAAAGTGAAVAGARLVSWDGRRLDFDGGGAAFSGHGHPLGHGRPVPSPESGTRPTLFSSGAAMLVHRETFLAAGGFDEAYFAYYEDVEMGWRLRLLGHDVVHVPDAVVRHVGGGSAGQLPDGRSVMLHERNALATVVKVYEDETLRRALPAALALAAWRSGADEDVIDDADPGSAWPPVPRPEWCGWGPLRALELDWPALWAARETVCRARRRSDAEIVPLLVRPLVPVPATLLGWAATRRAVDRFGLEELFGPMPPSGRLGALRAALVQRVRWHS